jgi:hypothetical protein
MSERDEPKRLMDMEPVATPDATITDDEADDPVDECPMGGEHEVEELRAATARTPLFVFCVKCRQNFTECGTPNEESE